MQLRGLLVLERTASGVGVGVEVVGLQVGVGVLHVRGEGARVVAAGAAGGEVAALLLLLVHLLHVVPVHASLPSRVREGGGKHREHNRRRTDAKRWWCKRAFGIKEREKCRRSRERGERGRRRVRSKW